MKQSEISVGSIYIIGRGSGRGGVKITNTRARVVEKHLANPDSYSAKRLDHVRVILVDEDGNARIWTEDHWNSQLHGKPREQIVPAKFILDLAFAEAELERERKAAEEGRRRKELRDKLEADAQFYITTKLQAKQNEIWVHASYDEEADEAKISSVRISGDAAETMVQFCNYFRFIDQDQQEHDEEEDENESEDEG